MNYTNDELRSLGIGFGNNVSVHSSVEFFNPSRIKLGSDVRIDCFCVISAGEQVTIGNNVHLASGVSIFGSRGVEIRDFVGLSNRVSIFTASDDYSTGFLTNPTIPEQFRNVSGAKVVLDEHVIVGCGSVIMPGVTLARGVAVGALSFVNKSVPEYFIVSGNPVRKLGVRNSDRLATLERQFRASKQADL